MTSRYKICYNICLLYTSGYIVLYNPNSTEVSTAGLYITDKPEKLDRWEIPARSVPAYGELLIVTDNNKTESALHQLQANFSLKKGETLILSDKGGNIPVSYTHLAAATASRS